MLETPEARAVGAPALDWLRSYDEYLDRVRGVSLDRRGRYLRFARKFVLRRSGSKPPDWPSVSADDVTDFVLYEAARHKPSGRREAATAMRALLRFLETRGAVRPGLDGAVPAMRQHKHASLPRHLTDEEVGRLVASCGESTPLGRRDRAVLVLLARLGLRAREVAANARTD